VTTSVRAFFSFIRTTAWIVRAASASLKFEYRPVSAWKYTGEPASASKGMTVRLAHSKHPSHAQVAIPTPKLTIRPGALLPAGYRRYADGSNGPRNDGVHGSALQHHPCSGRFAGACEKQGTFESTRGRKGHVATMRHTDLVVAVDKHAELTVLLFSVHFQAKVLNNSTAHKRRVNKAPRL
jgi:hypothetical protein